MFRSLIVFSLSLGIATAGIGDGAGVAAPDAGGIGGGAAVVKKPVEVIGEYAGGIGGGAAVVKQAAGGIGEGASANSGGIGGGAAVVKEVKTGGIGEGASTNAGEIGGGAAVVKQPADGIGQGASATAGGIGEGASANAGGIGAGASAAAGAIGEGASSTNTASASVGAIGEGASRDTVISSSSEEGKLSVRRRRFLFAPYSVDCNRFYGRRICYRLYESGSESEVPSGFSCWKTSLEPRYAKLNCTELSKLNLDFNNLFNDIVKVYLLLP